MNGNIPENKNNDLGFLSPEEAVNFFNDLNIRIKVPYLHTQARKGKIKRYRFGHQTRFKKSELLEFILNQSGSVVVEALALILVLSAIVGVGFLIERIHTAFIWGAF